MKNFKLFFLIGTLCCPMFLEVGFSAEVMESVYRDRDVADCDMYVNPDFEKIFIKIYERAEWGVDENGKACSGWGSLPQYVAPYVSFLQDFIDEYEISSVVDMGCGDWIFSQYLDWDGIDYVGIDVVCSLIEKNNEQFAAPNISFVHADGIQCSLPCADLLLCKEVMQHISNEKIIKLLEQLPRFRHCLIVNDVYPTTLTSDNHDINDGQYRPLDLTKPPFNLKVEEIFYYDAHGCKKAIVHISQ